MKSVKIATIDISTANAGIQKGQRYTIKLFKHDLIYEVFGFRVVDGYVEAGTCDGWLMILANEVWRKIGRHSERVNITRTLRRGR